MENWDKIIRDIDERYERLIKVEGEIHDREDRMFRTLLVQMVALTIQIAVLVVTLMMR